MKSYIFFPFPFASDGFISALHVQNLLSGKLAEVKLDQQMYCMTLISICEGNRALILFMSLMTCAYFLTFLGISHL